MKSVFACLLVIALITLTTTVTGSPIHKLHHAKPTTDAPTNSMKSNTALIDTIKEVIHEVDEIVEIETPPTPTGPTYPFYQCATDLEIQECLDTCVGRDNNACGCMNAPSVWGGIFSCFCSEFCPTNTTRTQELVNQQKQMSEVKKATKVTQSVAPIRAPLPHTCGTQTGSCPNNCQGGAFNYCECQEQSFGSNVYSCYCSNYCPAP